VPIFFLEAFARHAWRIGIGKCSGAPKSQEVIELERADQEGGQA